MPSVPSGNSTLCWFMKEDENLKEWVRINTDYTQKKKCVVPWGIFQSRSCINDKHTFCLPKYALPLCILASDAWKAVWCLPCTCIGHRESWEAAAVNSATGAVQAQALLHKEEPLGKWSQGSSRACFYSKLVMGRKAKISNHWRK